MTTTSILPSPVCVDVLVHVVEFLPQGSMAKFATISRRLAMLICSCNEKRETLIAIERMNRPLTRIQQEAITHYRLLVSNDPMVVLLYSVILFALETPGNAGASWNGNGLTFTVEWDVVKQQPGLVNEHVNSLLSTMAEKSTNGRPYFMQEGTPGAGQATYHFNYIPCYECQFNGARQFDCGIAGHDGGTRPL